MHINQINILKVIGMMPKQSKLHEINVNKRTLTVEVNTLTQSCKEGLSGTIFDSGLQTSIQSKKTAADTYLHGSVAWALNHPPRVSLSS